MAGKSDWMGDPNDIEGRLQFEQSKKALNPEKAEKDAKAAETARKLAQQMVARMAREKGAMRSNVKPKPKKPKPKKANSDKYKSPGFNGFDGTLGFNKNGPWG